MCPAACAWTSSSSTCTVPPPNSAFEGDNVELFGPGRGEDYAEPTADDWGRAADTISYEIFTCLRNRIPRLYEHAAEVLPAADLAKLDPATLL